jgi:hypothetical protein
MKTLHKILMGISLLSVAFVSCDDDDDDVSLTTQQKLQHKWQVQTVSARFVGPSQDTTAVYAGLPTDYYDFRADNKLYYNLITETDTLDYSILNDQRLLVDGDTVQIQTLSNNQLTVLTKDILTDSTYSEITAELRR